jgi:hypothetical protein
MMDFGTGRSMYLMTAWQWTFLQKLKLLVNANLVLHLPKSSLTAQISLATSWFYSAKHVQPKIAQVAASMIYQKSAIHR